MSDNDYDSDSDEYDINDPRTREHEAYKIAQDNHASARRRFYKGNDVDADGFNHEARNEDNNDPMEQRLENAREARGWAFDEANRRYEWNARWAGGSHEGVEDEADKRMENVESYNREIETLERHIDQAHDAQAHNPNSDSSSSSGEESGDDSDEEYEKNVRDAREARERRYDSDDQEEEEDDEQEEEGYDDVDDDDEYYSD